MAVIESTLPMRTLKLQAPEPTEAAIQAALMRRLVAAGWLVVRINGSGFKDSRGQFVRSYFIAGLNAASGFPDLLALRGDEARLFEVKRRGGELSSAQERFRDFAARRGIVVEVVEGQAGLEAVSAKYFG
jgi:hypothetical protein